jgi:hypothetical protein
MGALDKISNFMGWEIAPKKSKMSSASAVRTAGGSESLRKNLNNEIFPNQLERLARDLSDWREAIKEAEQSWWPYRSKMQAIYEDTVLSEQVSACLNRRRTLTMLRKYSIVDANGVENKKWTSYFEKTWFAQNMINYILDAQFYGYNLISIGDIEDGVPKFPSIIRRTHISPERTSVAPFLNNPLGYDFEERPYKDWHIWVPTLPTNGISTCGYGLLYNIAKTEILLRNNLAWNADFIEMFAQPYRWLKTASATDSEERRLKEEAMQKMGSAGYIITDMMDELEFLSDGARGNGYKSYNDFEARNEKKISKVLLGHSDGVDSVPGRLGAQQLQAVGSRTDDYSAASPVARALRDCQSQDAAFIEPVVNDKVIPALRTLGIPIPYGFKFKFLNDSEEREVTAMEATKNQIVATLALTMAQGGLKMDADYFTKITGVPCIDAPIEPDNNVIKDKKELAKGKPPLKEESMKRMDKPKHTTKTAKNILDGTI